MIRKEFKIGIFVIIVIIATFIVINILRGVDILGREYTYTARFDDVGSLVASAPVQIRGYAAGRVNSVEYDPVQDNFLVECTVDKRFRLPADSRMTLVSTSIMGGKGIRIDYGTSDETAKDGAVLQAGLEKDMLSSLSSGIEPLLEKLGTLADSLTEVSAGVSDVLSEENRANIERSVAHLRSTLASAARLSAALEGKSEEMQSLIENLGALSDKLAPIADSTGVVMGNVASISSSLESADLGGTVRKIDGTIEGINGVVDNLNLPLTKILNDADSLISEIKNNPKKYIKITVF